MLSRCLIFIKFLNYKLGFLFFSQIRGEEKIKNKIVGMLYIYILFIFHFSKIRVVSFVNQLIKTTICMCFLCFSWYLKILKHYFIQIGKHVIRF